MADKYWFPKLAQYVTEQGLTRTEFTAAAFKVGPQPKARAWANAMNDRNGISEVYAYKCKRVLEELEFPPEVCDFEQIP